MSIGLITDRSDGGCDDDGESGSGLLNHTSDKWMGGENGFPGSMTETSSRSGGGIAVPDLQIQPSVSGGSHTHTQ